MSKYIHEGGVRILASERGEKREERRRKSRREEGRRGSRRGYDVGEPGPGTTAAIGSSGERR